MVVPRGPFTLNPFLEVMINDKINNISQGDIAFLQLTGLGWKFFFTLHVQ